MFLDFGARGWRLKLALEKTAKLVRSKRIHPGLCVLILVGRTEDV